MVPFFAMMLLLLFFSSCSDKKSSPSGPAGDTSPPTVISIVPENSSTNIPLSTSITVTFSESMESSSVCLNTFTINGISGTVSCDTCTAIFTPDSPLNYNTWYTVTIATGVCDLAGNEMENKFSSTFRTIFPGENLVADAGVDQDASFNSPVNLDGGGSFDPNSLTITYEWRQILRHPAPAVIWTSSTSIDKPSFIVPDTVSTLEFELMVDNGVEDDLDTVAVTVLRDKDKALFVSKAGSDLYPDAGSRINPFATIQAAVNEAASLGADVYVSGGNYSGSIDLKNGVNIYGGFNDNGTLTWLHDIAGFPAHIAGGATAVKGSGVSSITLDGLYIISAESAGIGESSIGISLHGCSNITISRDSIHASRGRNGFSQVVDDPSLDGADGDNGSTGVISKCCALLTACNSLGGVYGANTTYRGGHGGGSGAVYSNAGETGRGPLPGTGGHAGEMGLSGSNGGSGGNAGGYLDSWASDGEGGSSFGSVSEGGYIPSDGTGGENGNHGSGGGGGGGGGGSVIAFTCNCTGGGGGGGGAGGDGGLGGPGSGGGGGSFGILLTNSTGISIYQTKVTTSRGGNGGSAGKGGDGGEGGEGRSGGARIVSDTYEWWFQTRYRYTGTGGHGGNGGYGQNGGNGGGGGGGPSICLVYESSQFVILDDCVSEYWYPASGGGGGDAGGTSTQDGMNGIATMIFPPF